MPTPIPYALVKWNNASALVYRANKIIRAMHGEHCEISYDYCVTTPELSVFWRRFHTLSPLCASLVLATVKPNLICLTYCQGHEEWHSLRELAARLANSAPPLNPVPGKTSCLNKGHVHLHTIFTDIVHALLPWSSTWTLSIPMEWDVWIFARCHTDYMAKVGKSSDP